MKKLLYIISLSTFIAILVQSCDFRDKGAYEISPISDIIIDTTGIPFEQYAFLDKELKINPIVKREGFTDDNFTYEWRITRKPGADFGIHEVISKEKNLNTLLKLVPSSDYYTLWFRIHDKTTGLMASQLFRVFVGAPSNQGLVIADSQDGINSDFSLIQDTLFTDKWLKEDGLARKETVFRRNLYSTANGSKFNGIVHSLFAQRLYKDGIYANYLHGASQKNAFRIGTLDYKVIVSGKDLFYDPLINLDIDFYGMNGPSQTWIINNQKIASRLAEAKNFLYIRKFSIPSPGNYTANKFIAVHPATAQQAIFYDEVLGKFFKMGSNLNVKAPPLEVDANTSIFNARDLPGFKVLGGGLGNISEVRFVMEKDDAYGVYCFTSAAAAAPRRIIDISAAPNIKNAVGFVFPNDQAVIYYATASNVYSIRIPQGGAPTYTDLYTSPDAITSFEMMRKTGFQPVPNTERILLVATYNGAEGKVTALPIPYTGLDLGLIDLSKKSTFGGFKKISAMAIQE